MKNSLNFVNTCLKVVDTRRFLEMVIQFAIDSHAIGDLISDK
jgi:hypothetical protein